MTHTYNEMREKGLDYLRTALGDEAVEFAIDCTRRFTVEVPAWQLWNGFGGGGRFEGGGSGGIAHSMEEIAADIGVIHKLTNATPTVGQHMLWFFSDDGRHADMEKARLVESELEQQGLAMGSISPTYFLAGSEDGSFTAQDHGTRERYIELTLLGAHIAAEIGNGVLSLWYPDGTNYPGQRGLQDKIGLMRDCMTACWERIPGEQREKLDVVLVEYKVFEPGTYSTTVPDWGTARELSRLFGEKGGVLVDMGHHHHGTNIEQIVATLITFEARGGFHFNTRYAADDDHSVQADYEMALLFHELLTGDVLFNENPKKNWSFAIDQMARTEKRIPSVLKTVDALKRSIARAALVDSAAMAAVQKSMDLIACNVAFEKALLHADTGPIVMESYHRQGLHPVPLEAYNESDYQAKIENDRS